MIASRLMQLQKETVQQMAAPVWQAYLPALDDAVRGKPFEAVSQDSGSRPKTDTRSTLGQSNRGRVKSSS